MTFRKQYLDNIPATKEQSRTMQIEVDKYLCNDIRKCEKENEREEKSNERSISCCSPVCYSSILSGLEPSLEANDNKGPAETQAGDSNGDIQEHHHI